MNRVTSKKAREMGVELRGNRNQCAGCGELFKSNGGFARHRRGEAENRRCLSAEEMRAGGMEKNGEGFWRTVNGNAWWAADHTSEDA